MLPEKPIFLVGFMGSGKSAVGAALAKTLGVPCIDLDAVLELDHGQSIQAMIEEQGEGAFRAYEREALDRVCEQIKDHPAVVATGGGTFIDPVSRQRIQGAGTSIWLDVPLTVVARRVPRDGSRPLYGHAVDVARLYATRREIYALAAVRVDAASEVVSVVVGRILEALKEPENIEP